MILIALLAALASQPVDPGRGPISVEQAFARKQAVGEAAFSAEVDAVLARLRARTDDVGKCAVASRSASAQLELVRHTGGPKAWAEAREAADAALARREALRSLYLDGGQAAPPYGLVSRMAARAKAERDPRLAELYRRAAVDQFARIDSVALRPFFGPGAHTTWEKGLDAAALAYVAATLDGERCATAVANTAWLKADLRAHGWYRISRYGAEADRAAWLMVQHAQHDLAFRESVLALLEPLWQVGETQGENFAALYDDVASARGRSTRFGLVGDCTAPGVWTPRPDQDAATTDAWRAKAGLPPLAEQIAARSRGCSP